VKPENIMVVRKSEEEGADALAAKIIDFGGSTFPEVSGGRGACLVGGWWWLVVVVKVVVVVVVVKVVVVPS
jgi:hypothetical protein